jgi:hypothetical protein
VDLCRINGKIFNQAFFCPLVKCKYPAQPRIIFPGIAEEYPPVIICQPEVVVPDPAHYGSVYKEGMGSLICQGCRDAQHAGMYECIRFLIQLTVFGKEFSFHEEIQKIIPEALLTEEDFTVKLMQEFKQFVCNAVIDGPNDASLLLQMIEQVSIGLAP